MAETPFRLDGFRRIPVQTRRRHVEQDRIVEHLDPRLGGVPETDVDRDGDTGAPIPGRRPNAKASVLGVFPDAVYTRLIDIEANTVPMFHPEYLPEILENGLRIRIAYP